MKTKKNWIALGLSVALPAVWYVAASFAADRKTTQYEVAIEPQKSDLTRMIEAYERLSSQYLTLVQQNLAQMNDADRRILEKLDQIEKKIDLILNDHSAVRPQLLQEAQNASEQNVEKKP